MKAYIIRPIRHCTPEQEAAISAYVARLEAQGYTVHDPRRDTVQEDDSNGFQVCEQNARAILDADEVHVWWEPTSEGSIFDLGMVWMLRELGQHCWCYPPHVFLANEFAVPEGKCFERVLLKWAEEDPGKGT